MTGTAGTRLPRTPLSTAPVSESGRPENRFVPAFRRRYRVAHSGGYNAFAHAGFLVVVGVVFIAVAGSGVVHSRWYEWLAVLAGLVTFNFGVYAVHRGFGHHRSRLGRLFYLRHSIDHHGFFSEHAMSYDGARDWRVILFPPWLIVLFALAVAAPLGALTALATGANAGRLLACGLMGGYLLYEFFHTCHHLPVGHRLTRWPWLKQMRELHRLHHRRSLMGSRNFDIIAPLSDWLFGTLYSEPHGGAGHEP